ncbi:MULTISPECIES: hypothetical protein [unclassified Pseudomonas]|uniref:hypothetical protein n=1 Tax=unclassified Pseudomonas TaxID=196821 RepID=UPI0039B73215
MRILDKAAVIGERVKGEGAGEGNSQNMFIVHMSHVPGVRKRPAISFGQETVSAVIVVMGVQRSASEGTVFYRLGFHGHS